MSGESSVRFLISTAVFHLEGVSDTIQINVLKLLLIDFRQVSNVIIGLCCLEEESDRQKQDLIAYQITAARTFIPVTKYHQKLFAQPFYVVRNDR